MVLDIRDELENYDIVFTKTDKYRCYNLLEKRFEDNAEIGLNIAEMMKIGLTIQQMESLFLEYLSNFSVNIEKLTIQEGLKGNFTFDCLFKEDFS